MKHKKTETGSDFSIVKGTELPMPRAPGNTYPFAQMKPGDAFFLGVERKGAVATAAAAYGKRHGMQFRVCKAPQGGYGCWRVK